MRTIKFIAWFKSEQRMHNVNTIGFSEGFIDTNKYNGDLDDFIIMQFTGAEDIDGNEVFEGDILYNKDRNQHQVVYWCEENLQWKCRYVDDNRDTTTLKNSLGNLNLVVGNMYKNPELFR